MNSAPAPAPPPSDPRAAARGAKMAAAKSRKVTITLVDQTQGSGHRFGVSALASTSTASWGGGNQLLSAGRDGTICSWCYDATGGSPPEANFVLEDHTDWVNDLVLLDEGGKTSALVSCSSDTTLKVWRPSAPGQAMRCNTLRRHTDYVKALAYAPQARLLASASCDRTVLLWDLQTLTPYGGSGTAEGSSHRDSVYCLATNPSATLLASGSVDTDVRLWDPRAADGHFRLRGHTDVVRGLALSDDGRRLLSCGSDRTVRIWHLGERRCEQVLTPHVDSVYCVAVDAAWSSVLSGARDGTVCETPLRGGASPQSTLLCKGRGIVQRLHAPAEEPGLLWVATSDSTLNCWALPRSNGAMAAGSGASARPTTPLKAAPPPSPPLTPSGVSLGVVATPDRMPADRYPGGSPRASAAVPPDSLPTLSVPMLSIPGAPGVHQYAIMPSKLQVLTEDTRGDATLWDVWRGEVASRHPKLEGEEKGPYEAMLRAALKQQVAASSWFTASARSGSLEITLEPQTCFNAEVYAYDLGLGGEADVRINLGERMLLTLFSHWMEAQGAREEEALLPFRALEQVPLLVTEGSTVVLRSTASQLAQAPAETIPSWVSQAVLQHQWQPKEPLKLSFFLAPHASDDLPPLAAGSNKLSAPKVLKMRKVLSYVANRLPNVPDPAALERSLELLCNEKPLPPDMSLASVRRRLHACSCPRAASCHASSRADIDPCTAGPCVHVEEWR